MSKKLTKEDIKKKIKYLDKRKRYYTKKLEDIKNKENRIGFIHYD